MSTERLIPAYFNFDLCPNACFGSFFARNPRRRNSQIPMSPMSVTQSPANSNFSEALSPMMSYDPQFAALSPPQVPPPESFQSNPEAPVALVPPLLENGNVFDGMMPEDVQMIVHLLRDNV